MDIRYPIVAFVVLVIAVIYANTQKIDLVKAVAQPLTNFVGVLVLLVLVGAAIYWWAKSREPVVIRGVVTLSKCIDSLRFEGPLEQARHGQLETFYQPQPYWQRMIDATSEKPVWFAVFRMKPESLPFVSFDLPVWLLIEFAAGIQPNPPGTRLRGWSNFATAHAITSMLSAMSLSSEGRQQGSLTNIYDLIFSLPENDRNEILANNPMYAKEIPVVNQGQGGSK